MTTWNPASWQTRKAQQQPNYIDAAALEPAVAQLSRLPPHRGVLGSRGAARAMAAAQRGEQFLLQAGDCAESFAECESDRIAKQLKVILQVSLVLLHGLKRPIIRVGRMAGQYAKPRSADTETARWRDAAQLSRRHHQPSGVHAPRRASRIRSCCCAATSARR